jgi:hypothetical protein
MRAVGFVAALKQMPAPPVHAIELSGVAAQKLPHHPCDGGVSGSQHQLEGLKHHGPCVTGSLGFTQDPLQPLAEVIAVAIPPKILRRSIPRPMTWCKAPGASTRALRGKKLPTFKMPDWHIKAIDKERTKIVWYQVSPAPLLGFPYSSLPKLKQS